MPDDTLPQDLISEILERLPVESLLRFKSVSKQWRDLIDAPDFAASQLNQAKKSKSTACVVFNNGPSYRSIHLSSLRREVAPGDLRTLNFPGANQSHVNLYRFVGSVNGLMCAYIGIPGLVVWNPSIGTNWLVPNDNYGFEFGLAFWFWGFGHDAVSDDYKVVRVALVRSNGGASINVFVWIYGFKTGDWRRIGDMGSYYPSRRFIGVFSNYAVHWFRVLSLPDCREDNFSLRSLANLAS